MSGKAHAESVVIRSHQRIRSLQIDVIADEHERALRIPEVDASGSVGDDDGANAHAREHANGERDFLRRISLIKMNAALHGCDWNGACISDDHPPGMPDRGRLRERRNLGIRDASRIAERVGEGAEAGAKNKTDLRSKRGARKDQLRGGVGECVLVAHEFCTRNFHRG